MQTLNVGAGRSDAEHQEAEEKRREHLRAESRNAANYFFWAAGLAVFGTGLAPVHLTLLVNVGIVDVLSLYGTWLERFQALTVYGVSLGWVLALVGLGYAARTGRRWPFRVGMVLYGADMIALMVTFSLWAVGIHGFFAFQAYRGQKALTDISNPGAATF